MTTYLVSIEEVVRYTIEVDAPSEDEAEDIALEMLGSSDNPNQWFTSIEEREVYYTVEKG